MILNFRRALHNFHSQIQFCFESFLQGPFARPHSGHTLQLLMGAGHAEQPTSSFAMSCSPASLLGSQQYISAAGAMEAEVNHSFSSTHTQNFIPAATSHRNWLHFFLISLFFVAHNPFLVKGSFLSNLFLHLGLCKTMQHATPLSSS